MKCFRYSLNRNNQGPAGVLPSGSITGLWVDETYYGAALIDDLAVLADWNAVEITPAELNTRCAQPPTDEFPNPRPPLVQLEPCVRAQYAELLQQVVAPYLPEERETWFVQVDEAQKHAANPLIDASEIPLVTAVAHQRSLSVADVCTTILAKNVAYRTQVGVLLGRQQATIAQLWSGS